MSLDTAKHSRYILSTSLYTKRKTPPPPPLLLLLLSSSPPLLLLLLLSSCCCSSCCCSSSCCSSSCCSSSSSCCCSSSSCCCCYCYCFTATATFYFTFYFLLWAFGYLLSTFCFLVSTFYFRRSTFHFLLSTCYFLLLSTNFYYLFSCYTNLRISEVLTAKLPLIRSEMHLCTTLGPDQVFSLHSEFHRLNPRCLKEEGSVKVPVRLQPDADIWDIRVESVRVRNRSSTLPLKGHPLTSMRLGEHPSGSGWERLEKKGNSSEMRLLKRGPSYTVMPTKKLLHQPFFTPDPGPDAQDAPARLQGLEAISVLSRW